MSRSEDFDSAFWDDPDVAELSANGKLVYIWSWTNPRCNMSGVYQVTLPRIVAETGLTSDDATSAIAEVEEHGFAFYDGRWIWVRSRVKRLRQKTQNIAKSIGRHVAKLPQGHPYRRMFVAEYGSSGWLEEYLTGLSTDTRLSVDDSPLTVIDLSVYGRTADPYQSVADSPGDGLRDGELVVSEDRSPPNPPKGGRQRDVALYEEELSAWVAEHFPGCRPSSVGTILGYVRRNRGDLSPDGVRAFAATEPNFAYLIQPDQEAA